MLIIIAIPIRNTIRPAGSEDLLARERRLAGDGQDLGGIAAPLRPDAEDGEERAAADPDHGERHVDPLEEEVPVIAESTRTRRSAAITTTPASSEQLNDIRRALLGGRGAAGVCHERDLAGRGGRMQVPASRRAARRRPGRRRCRSSTPSGRRPSRRREMPSGGRRRACPRYSCAIPSARTASPLKSDNRPKFRSIACVHAMCVHGESREIPTGCTPTSSNSARRSRTSSTSFMQVEDQSNG